MNFAQRMRGLSGHRGMGDLWSDIFGPSITTIVSQLQQYSSDQITTAYNYLLQQYQSETQDLLTQTQWFTANGNTLTPEGQQLYASSLQGQADAVNTLAGWVSTAQSVMQAIGLQGPAGLSGARRRLGYLGIAPIIIAGVILVIIVLIAGITISIWNARVALQDQNHANIAKAQTMIQQQAVANTKDLIAAGWTPQQIQAYMDSLYKAQNDQNPSASTVPWGWIAGVAGAVFAAKYIFE
jgi:hypothetical protein